MLIEVIETWVMTPRYKRRGKRRLKALVECDACHMRELLPYVKGVWETRKRVCSAECDTKLRSRGGELYNDIVATNMKRYGAKFASATHEGKRKQEETNMARYGVKATSQSPIVEAKRLETCLALYGGNAATSDFDVRAKVKLTCDTKFGGGVLCDDSIRAQFNATMLERHGALWPAQSPTILAKQHQTNVERCGKAIPFLTDEAKAKAQSPEAKLKRHLTMKRNGTYGKSKPEDRLYEVLCELFGEDDVERQAWVKRWPIDFYVKSIDTYVQYDSYWHGFKNGVLRDINEVAEGKTNRDVQIHRKMLTDIAQREYFVKQGMRLVRIQNLTAKQITVDALNRAGLL